MLLKRHQVSCYLTIASTCNLRQRKRRVFVSKRYAISDDYNAIYPRKAVKSTKTTGNTRVPMAKSSQEVYFTSSLSILAVLIVLSNVCVCCLVCFNKALRTYPNWLIVSLAVSDILTGGVLLPIYLNEPSSVVPGYLACIILLSGVANLCSVTYDRYIAIMKPLEYPYRSPVMFKRALVLSWLFPIIYSLLPLLWNTDPTRGIHKAYIICLQFFGIVVPYIFITFAYVRIFRQVRGSLAMMKDFRIDSPRRTKNDIDPLRRNKNDIDPLRRTKNDIDPPRRTKNDIDPPRTTKNDIDPPRRTKNDKRRTSSDVQVAKVFCIISVAFIFCWLPIIYITTAGTILNRLDIIPQALVTVSFFTIAISSLVNPLIYAFLKPDFKLAIRTVFSRRTRAQSRESSSGISLVLKKSIEGS